MAEINITFSALSPKLAEQIAAQGFDFDAEAVRAAQVKADAVGVCTIHGLIPESASKRARNRIFGDIVKAIRPREISHAG